MKRSLSRSFVNPSALYRPAVEARHSVDHARQQVATFLSTQPEHIVFTSGGTESCNLAIRGVLDRHTSGHIITTGIEHHAVLEAIRVYEERGFDVTYLPVDELGFIDLRSFTDALRTDTILVSIMYANNEIGSILPIADIGRMILRFRKQHRSVYPYLHTDACQAAEYLDLAVDALHVDLLSLNGSKIYGPKGVGALYVRPQIYLEPQLRGGGQEQGLRSGTENVPAIVALGEATERIDHGSHDQIRKFRDEFVGRIKREIKQVRINTPLERSLPNYANVTFFGAPAEEVILYLDAAGIACSSGSACTTESDDVSHVLLALGHHTDDARASVRFTLGRGTTLRDIDRVMRVLPGIIDRVRKQQALKAID